VSTETNHINQATQHRQARNRGTTMTTRRWGKPGSWAKPHPTDTAINITVTDKEHKALITVLSEANLKALADDDLALSDLLDNVLWKLT